MAGGCGVGPGILGWPECLLAVGWHWLKEMAGRMGAGVASGGPGVWEKATLVVRWGKGASSLVC